MHAAQEELFIRIKNDASFPSLALKNCLHYTNTVITEIDTIVYYEKPFLKFERILKTYLQVAPKDLYSFLQAMNIWSKEKLFIKQNIYAELKKIEPAFNKKIFLFYLLDIIYHMHLPHFTRLLLKKLRY